MKLYYIANIRIPSERAHSTQVIKMSEAFADWGAKVTLVLPNKKSQIEIGDDFRYYNVSQNFEIKRLPSFDFLGHTLLFGSFLYYFDLLSFIFSLLFFSDAEKGDIIYSREPILLKLFSKTKYKLCAEIHDIPQNRPSFIRSLKRVHKVIVLNSIIKKELISLGLPENNILTASDAVDIKEFNLSLSKEEARTKLSIPLDKKIILYTGHLYSWKGADSLAKSAKDFDKNVEFVFIGGVDRELNNFKNEYASLNNIKIIPFQKRNLMPIYMAAADVLTIPNSAKDQISVKYTSPLKLFEYMAVKRPIVASDLPSLREVLDEKTCVFAEADDPKSFSLAIKKILKDDNLAESITTNAFERVKQYSWVNRADKILKAIN